MSTEPRSEKSSGETPSPKWKNLYRIGGATALVAAVLFLAEVSIEMTGGIGLASVPSHGS